MSDRILVVDDEKSVRDLICQILAEDGFTIFSAPSAREALQTWHDNGQPGIVLTDLRLAGDQDGVALCSKIRYESPRTIVVAMTGHSDEYELAYCRGVGFSDVLCKPISTQDLLDCMRCVAQQRKRWETIA